MGPSFVVSRLDDVRQHGLPVGSVVAMLKPFREFLLLFQRPQHVVHGRPFPFQGPHHAVRQTDGLAGIP